MNDKNFNRVIVILSFVIPIAVALLFRVKIEGYDFSFLPPIYAAINGLTALLLIAALIAIKQGKRDIHEIIMKTNLGLSALFLLMYVVYHITSESTPFLGEGIIRYIYFFVLISHIVLSIAVVPLVLLTFSKAVLGNYIRHKKLARVTFPIWFYVAFTGVIVYLMISPYYV